MKILEQAKTKLGNTVELVGNPVKNGVLIIGVFHGDEPQGKFLIEEYLKLKSSNAESVSLPIKDTGNVGGNTLKSLISKGGKNADFGKNLLFIPCLNPDGMQLGRRTNSNGVDLNRNFPTKNWGQNKGENATCDDSTSDYFGGVAPASEIETQFVIAVIEKYSPCCILTLHAPYKVVNYDGPAKEIAEEISKIIGYPAEGSIGYPTPGSFGTYCGVERNIPTITLELDEETSVENLLQPMFEILEFFDNF